MAQLIPVVNQSFLYLYAMVPFMDGDDIAISPGQCRDSNNIIDIVLSEETVINPAVVGLNGIDNGALANNTAYDVYVIADSTCHNPTGALLSLSSNETPTLPYGYDSFRKVFHLFTDGSADIKPFFANGLGNDRTFIFQDAPQILNAGSSTTPATINVGLNNVLTGHTWLNVLYTYDPSAAASVAHVFASGQEGTILPALQGASTSAIQGVMQVLGNVTTTDGLQYDVDSGDALSLWLYSFSCRF